MLSPAFTASWRTSSAPSPSFSSSCVLPEVSSRFKKTGGLYLYARATFGPLAGFEIGWLAWMVRLTAFAALCNLFVDYLGYFLPGRSVRLRPRGSGRCRRGVSRDGQYRRRALASLVGNIFTIGKLVPLVLLVVAGSFFIDPRNYSLAVPPGYAGFSASVLLLMFAFTGFELAVIPAGESRDPRRHLPFALLTGDRDRGAAVRGDSGRLHRHLPELGELSEAAGRRRRSSVRKTGRSGRLPSAR